MHMPLGNKYIHEPKTIGEQIRNRRLELGLLQKDIAQLVGVTEDCVTLWENNQSEVRVSNMPKVIQFLGYIPIAINTSTIGGRIKMYRICNGLSHKKFGKLISVDATTVGAWENGCQKPLKQHLKQLDMLFAIPEP